jgi:tRNA guanosine-2'-O-methyltransferase
LIWLLTNFLTFRFCIVSQNLLPWLRSRKEEGYYIVGLEQTSSSVSLSEFEFPDKPIVLLLGKEKEGIPVEFLQVVDQCLEIPQLGIIRSLNVHVSGAIAIWEHTRQKIAQGKLLID